MVEGGVGFDWGHIGGLLTGFAALVVAVVGGIKNRNERKAGVASAQREGEVTMDLRYQSVLDQVEDHLLEPMRKDMERLREEIDGLRTELDTERTALDEERKKRQDLQRRFDTLERDYHQVLEEREKDRRYIAQLLEVWQSPPDPPARED